MAQCPRCGAEVQSEDKFCHSCGLQSPAAAARPRARGLVAAGDQLVINRGTIDQSTSIGTQVNGECGITTDKTGQKRRVVVV
ncbi:MAG TPA: zinc ribbon domain-containing protein, partial [Anaerolineae bacterium]|nr:zinc ribbon domain-containing protein [Anaerolineae bacterium]